MTKKKLTKKEEQKKFDKAIGKRSIYLLEGIYIAIFASLIIKSIELTDKGLALISGWNQMEILSSDIVILLGLFLFVGAIYTKLIENTYKKK